MGKFIVRERRILKGESASKFSWKDFKNTKGMFNSVGESEGCIKCTYAMEEGRNNNLDIVFSKTEVCLPDSEEKITEMLQSILFSNIKDNITAKSISNMLVRQKQEKTKAKKYAIIIYDYGEDVQKYLLVLKFKKSYRLIWIDCDNPTPEIIQVGKSTKKARHH